MTRKAIAVFTLMALMGAGLWAADKVVLNALFMKQAGFSEEDITAGTKDFHGQEPRYPGQPHLRGLRGARAEDPHRRRRRRLRCRPLRRSLHRQVRQGRHREGDTPAGRRRQGRHIPRRARRLRVPRQILGHALDQRRPLPVSSIRRCSRRRDSRLRPRRSTRCSARPRPSRRRGIVEYPIVLPWNQAETLTCDFTTITALFGGVMAKDGKPTL